MCDPISMAIGGAALGYGAAGTTTAAVLGGIGGAALGAAGKKAMAPRGGPPMAPVLRDWLRKVGTKAPQHAPDGTTLLSGGGRGGFGQGFSSTLLTGAGGADPKKGRLGRNTLLGE